MNSSSSCTGGSERSCCSDRSSGIFRYEPYVRRSADGSVSCPNRRSRPTPSPSLTSGTVGVAYVRRQTTDADVVARRACDDSDVLTDGDHEPLPLGSELPDGIPVHRAGGGRAARMGRHRCAVRCRPVVVCGVWPVPPPLSDVPADRRGVGVAARTDHGHAVGRRGHGRRRRHVRRVHGPVPGVPRVRGRLPVARAVRPDDGARARPGGTAPHPPRAVPPVARTGRRAPAPRAPADRHVLPAHRPAVPAAPDARARATPDVAVRAAAAGDGARRGDGCPRDGRRPLRVRAGPVVPRGQPRHDPRARPQRLARGRSRERSAAAERSRRTTAGSTRPARSRVATRARSRASTT